MTDLEIVLDILYSNGWTPQHSRKPDQMVYLLHKATGKKLYRDELYDNPKQAIESLGMSFNYQQVALAFIMPSKYKHLK